MKHLGIVIIFIVLGILLAFFAVPGLRNPMAGLTVPSVPTPPTPTTIPTPVPTTAVSSPSKIFIPKLGVNTIIESVEKDEVGNMDIPSNYNNVAWYSLGPKPGEHGSAVIAGHVDTPQGDLSVFGNLTKLTAGDQVVIKGTNGKELTFTVYKAQNYKLSNIPLEEIFARTGPEKKLNLITCSGTWDKTSKMYTDRYVVYARIEE